MINGRLVWIVNFSIGYRIKNAFLAHSFTFELLFYDSLSFSNENWTVQFEQWLSFP